MAMNVTCDRDECDFNAGGSCDYSGDIHLTSCYMLNGNTEMDCDMFEGN